MSEITGKPAPRMRISGLHRRQRPRRTHRQFFVLVPTLRGWESICFLPFSLIEHQAVTYFSHLIWVILSQPLRVGTSSGRSASSAPQSTALKYSTQSVQRHVATRSVATRSNEEVLVFWFQRSALEPQADALRPISQKGTLLKYSTQSVFWFQRSALEEPRRALCIPSRKTARRARKARSNAECCYEDDAALLREVAFWFQRSAFDGE